MGRSLLLAAAADSPAMAGSGVSDIKKLLGDILDKLTSFETKLTAVDHELSTVKLDQRRLHDAVMAEKRPAFPIELPEYDGTDDPAVWLHRFETFFSLQRTEDDDVKVCVAAFHMTGKAQIWYCGLKRKRGVPTWPQFADSLRRRFGAPTHGNNALGELAKLRRTGSVAKYQFVFPTEQELVAIFIAGLRDPQLRADVEQRRPATLEEAMRLALVLEHRYN